MVSGPTARAWLASWLALVCLALALPARADFSYPSFPASLPADLSLAGSSSFISCSGLCASCPEPTPPPAELYEHYMTQYTNFTTVYEQDPAALLAGQIEPCQRQVALTPPAPNRAGAVWHRVPQSVARGFETTFTFRLMYPSRVCTTQNRIESRTLDAEEDPNVDGFTAPVETIYLRTWSDCDVSGAGGFAFVLQNAPEGSAAVGDAGLGLGYGAVRESAAIEFDTHHDASCGDPPEAHVSVQARGAGKANSPEHRFRLAWAGESTGRFLNLTDGREHNVTLRYTPSPLGDLAARHLDASPHLLRHLLKGPVGTLELFVDNARGVNNTALAAPGPVLRLPFSLEAALRTAPGGLAYVGFTAATGARWQRHAITSWSFVSFP
eukprot:tig00021348_g20529.t1